MMSLQEITGNLSLRLENHFNYFLSLNRFLLIALDILKLVSLRVEVTEEFG